MLQPCAALLIGLFRAHPARTCAAAIFALLLSGIVLNAVLFQRGHHPAPLFGPKSRERSSPAAMPPPPIPMPRPPAEEAGSGQQGAAQSVPDAVASVPPPRITKLAQPSRSRKEDAIGQLLRDETKAQPQGAGPKTTSANVLAAQRALHKLGYDVALDGHMGAATRQALDKFGHEHHLATRGELTPKLLRELTGSAAPPHG